jgi:hypothetical protein
MWNAKQHSYEELRDVVVDVLHQRLYGNNKYNTLVENTARVLNEREGSNANLGTGFAYQGAAAGVAAEAEFLRLIDVANANGTIGRLFDQAKKERFIRAKIEAFRKGLAPHLKTLPGAATEDLDINPNAVQSIIRIARNEAGHPSGASPPSREQVYVNLQIFVHYADQVGRLRKELA